MRVFGSVQDNCFLAKYQRVYYPPARIVVYFYRGEIWYTCGLCSQAFNLWLCDDRVWHRLPKKLRGPTICLNCFTAIRRLPKINKPYIPCP